MHILHFAGPSSPSEAEKHFSRNVTQPLNLVINFYTSNHPGENDATNDANLKGGVYPEVKVSKRDFRQINCHFNGSIYENGETVN